MGIDDSKGLIIENSEIEFAIIGPQRHNRGVLIRSKDIRLSLIGAYSIESDKNYLTDYMHENRGRFVSDFTFSRAIAKSYVRRQHSDDYRGSEYWFVWKGKTDKQTEQLIQKEFTLRIDEILKSLEDNDYISIEWLIAPIILMCSSSSAKYNSSIGFGSPNKHSSNALLIHLITGAALVIVTLIISKRLW